MPIITHRFEIDGKASQERFAAPTAINSSEEYLVAGKATAEGNRFAKVSG
jgi:hypothetical protein